MVVIYSGLLALVLAAVPSSGFVVSTPRARFAALHAKKVFIDGEAGTTGLQVRERLEDRKDLEILKIPDDLRKDEETRKKYINDADCVILCKCEYHEGSVVCGVLFGCICA